MEEEEGEEEEEEVEEEEEEEGEEEEEEVEVEEKAEEEVEEEEEEEEEEGQPEEPEEDLPDVLHGQAVNAAKSEAVPEEHCPAFSAALRLLSAPPTVPLRLGGDGSVNLASPAGQVYNELVLQAFASRVGQPGCPFKRHEWLTPVGTDLSFWNGQKINWARLSGILTFPVRCALGGFNLPRGCHTRECFSMLSGGEEVFLDSLSGAFDRVPNISHWTDDPYDHMDKAQKDASVGLLIERVHEALFPEEQDGRAGLLLIVTGKASMHLARAICTKGLWRLPEGALSAMFPGRPHVEDSNSLGVFLGITSANRVLIILICYHPCCVTRVCMRVSAVYDMELAFQAGISLLHGGEEERVIPRKLMGVVCRERAELLALLTGPEPTRSFKAARQAGYVIRELCTSGKRYGDCDPPPCEEGVALEGAALDSGPGSEDITLDAASLFRGAFGASVPDSSPVLSRMRDWVMGSTWRFPAPGPDGDGQLDSAYILKCVKWFIQQYEMLAEFGESMAAGSAAEDGYAAWALSQHEAGLSGFAFPDALLFHRSGGAEVAAARELRA